MVLNCLLHKSQITTKESLYDVHFFVCKIILKNHTSSISHWNPCGAYVVFFFRGSNCFTGARWFLYATHFKTLWSSSLSLVLKIITLLAQLKCCNQEALLLLSNDTLPINSLKALKHRHQNEWDLGDFDCGMAVGARWTHLSISAIADLLGSAQTT